MRLKAPPELRNGYKDKKHLGKVALMKCVACAKEKAGRNTRLEIHHKTGCGIGKKASDLLTIPLCNFHHQSGGRGLALHRGIDLWEEKFGTQQDLILQIHERIGLTIYKDYLLQINSEWLKCNSHLTFFNNKTEIL